ncbi:hypothetical protein B0H17DRAFT_1197728 [Mycena rosella]|uniref:Uncharacterized protein n=1 Tax=Mycena rosella TaxID=1033263 RepID=A0AAD7DQJ0_MYCRO|nr:hypothetical protein B0H17DRAFT_1197728 [Mycena rosella]
MASRSGELISREPAASDSTQSTRWGSSTTTSTKGSADHILSIMARCIDVVEAVFTVKGTFKEQMKEVKCRLSALLGWRPLSGYSIVQLSCTRIEVLTPRTLEAGPGRASRPTALPRVGTEAGPPQEDGVPEKASRMAQDAELRARTAEALLELATATMPQAVPFGTGLLPVQLLATASAAHPRPKPVKKTKASRTALPPQTAPDHDEISPSAIHQTPIQAQGSSSISIRLVPGRTAPDNDEMALSAIREAAVPAEIPQRTPIRLVKRRTALGDDDDEDPQPATAEQDPWKAPGEYDEPFAVGSLRGWCLLPIGLCEISAQI